MGLSQKQAVAILYAISAILGLSAVLIATSAEVKAIVLVFAFCVAFAIGIALIRSLDPKRFGIHEEDEAAAEEKASDEAQKDISEDKKD